MPSLGASGYAEKIQRCIQSMTNTFLLSLKSGRQICHSSPGMPPQGEDGYDNAGYDEVRRHARRADHVRGDDDPDTDDEVYPMLPSTHGNDVNWLVNVTFAFAREITARGRVFLQLSAAGRPFLTINRSRANLGFRKGRSAMKKEYMCPKCGEKTSPEAFEEHVRDCK